MIPGLKPLTIGAVRKTIPGGTINALIAGLQDLDRRVGGAPKAPSSEAPGGAVTALATNQTGAALPEFGVVRLARQAFDFAASPTGSPIEGSAPMLLPIVPDVQAPSDGESLLAITQEPIPASGVGRVVVMGLSYARVYITDASHTHATAISADVDKLVSGTSGPAQIVYKPSGTGVKFALVRLGGGGGGAPSSNGFVGMLTESLPAAEATTYDTIPANIRTMLEAEYPELELIASSGAPQTIYKLTPGSYQRVTVVRVAEDVESGETGFDETYLFPLYIETDEETVEPDTVEALNTVALPSPAQGLAQFKETPLTTLTFDYGSETPTPSANIVARGQSKIHTLDVSCG